MTQPGSAAILHEDETASPPRWRGPPYDHLRAGKLACADGYAATTKSSAASESEASRSPSPSTESSNHYAASTSSWATSTAGTEFGFPSEDDGEQCANKWDEESHSPHMSDRPSTPANPVSRFMSRFPARSSSGPSSLRNTICARGRGEAETASSESQGTDASDSECETARNHDDSESDNDNDWSGQNGNLESLVIAAVDGDLALAAHLIPLLHRDFSLSIKNKIESWQYTSTAATSNGDGSPETSGSGSADKTSYTETSPDQSPSTSRKRRRTGFDGGSKRGVGRWDGEEEEDEDEIKAPGPQSVDMHQMLACPFHKCDSAKYGIQHGNSGNGKKHKYRACMGPGFKSIQRLKEHLKRVHSPVQCERCHEIFPGTDRAACLSRLAEHRKKDVSCELGDPSRKEGIDEAQWAALDKQNRKKNQETHRVEKWFEIWDVLFPSKPRPKSPWHDMPEPILPTFSSPSKDAESFSNLFLNIMDHKIAQGDIDPTDQNKWRLGIKSVAQMAYKAHMNLRPKLSPETSSSDSRNRLSLTGASSTQLSDPTTAASHALTAMTAGTSIASGPRSQAGRPHNSYTLNAPYGIRVPRTMPAQPQQFMAPVATGTEMAPPIPPTPLQSNGIPTFGGMSAGDPGYYYPYMFSAPQGSWAPNNPVGFSTPMGGMPQDFGMGGASFFGDAPNYGTPGDGA